MVDYSRHEWLVLNWLKVQVKLRVPQGTKKNLGMVKIFFHTKSIYCIFIF